MSEIDPFLDRVGQGADYLRGFMRTPLRRGMAVAGGFALLAGSLSACGGSPDETTSAAATESSNSTPALTEAPLAETQVAPSPTSTAEATISAEPTTENQEKSAVFGALVGSATVAVVANCFGGDMERLYMTSFNSPSGSEFPASLQVSCDTASTVDARIIHDASQIEHTDQVLFIVSDLELGSGIVPGSGFGPKLVNGDTTPNTRDYAVDVFNINPQSTECYAIGLTEEVHTDTRIISMSLDTNNKVIGKTTVSCANFQPGTIH